MLFVLFVAVWGVVCMRWGGIVVVCVSCLCLFGLLLYCLVFVVSVLLMFVCVVACVRCLFLFGLSLYGLCCAVFLHC